jgi:hypothetical protein
MNSESKPTLSVRLAAAAEVVVDVDVDGALVVDADGSESPPHAARTSEPMRTRAAPLTRVTGAPDHGCTGPMAILPSEHHSDNVLRRTHWLDRRDEATP